MVTERNEIVAEKEALEKENTLLKNVRRNDVYKSQNINVSNSNVSKDDMVLNLSPIVQTPNIKKRLMYTKSADEKPQLQGKSQHIKWNDAIFSPPSQLYPSDPTDCIPPICVDEKSISKGRTSQLHDQNASKHKPCLEQNFKALSEELKKKFVHQTHLLKAAITNEEDCVTHEEDCATNVFPDFRNDLSTLVDIQESLQIEQLSLDKQQESIQNDVHLVLKERHEMELVRCSMLFHSMAGTLHTSSFESSPFVARAHIEYNSPSIALNSPSNAIRSPLPSQSTSKPLSSINLCAAETKGKPLSPIYITYDVSPRSSELFKKLGIIVQPSNSASTPLSEARTATLERHRGKPKSSQKRNNNFQCRLDRYE